MTSSIRLVGRLLLIGVIFASVASTSVAQAQFDDEVVEDDNPRPANMIDRVMIQQANNLNQVDQWVFGRLGGSAGAHGKIDSSLLLCIQDLDRTCGLTEAQKNKLRLAGRGDIKRFFDRVEAVKQKFPQAQNDPNLNMNIWREIQPLQAELNAGLFGDGSIYAKTIKRTLDSDQAARIESHSRERAAFRFRATVEAFIANLDKGMGLTERDRQRFLAVLMNDARPPKTFGQWDYWYLMLQTAKLPEAELKAIFDAPQRRLLSRQLAQARAMVQPLKAAGVFAADADEPAPIRAAPAIKMRTAGPDAKAVKRP